LREDKLKFVEVWAFHGSALFYLLTAFWSIGYFINDRRFRLRQGQLFLLIGFALETAALIARGIVIGRPPVFSGFEFIVAVVWALVACCLIMSYLYRVRLIIPFAIPIITILLIMVVAVNFPEHGQVVDNVGKRALNEHLWITFHTCSIILGMGSFVVSFTASLMYLFQEHRLKTHSGAYDWGRLLPALEKLERLNLGAVGLGIALLTLGLLVPILFASNGNQTDEPGSLVIWGIVLWVVYTSLFVLHIKGPFGRRTIALLTVSCAVIGTLAYPVIRFIFAASPNIHKTLS
jgi:ABC-type transport system involved in cytochrome c biogenesis permease subunit